MRCRAVQRVGQGVSMGKARDHTLLQRQVGDSLSPATQRRAGRLLLCLCLLAAGVQAVSDRAMARSTGSHLPRSTTASAPSGVVRYSRDASNAKPSTASANLSGVIRDLRGPLAGASLSCRQGKKVWTARTDRHGVYRLRLSPGSYTCVAAASRHRASTARRVRIVRGKSSRLDFALALAHASAPAPTPTPVPRPTMTPYPAIEPSGPMGGATCTWQSGSQNVFITDSNARYYAANVRADPAVILTVTGTYPRSRFTSLGVYSGAAFGNTPQAALLAGFSDQAFLPDPGSVNPFVRGTPRGVGTYTLHIVFGPKPVAPVDGTLYVDVPAGTYLVLIYRLYLPDTGADDQGGVPLPSVTARLVSSGAATGCPIPDLSSFFSAPTPITSTTRVSASPTVTGTPTSLATATPTVRVSTPTPTPSAAQGFSRLGGPEVDIFGNIDGAYLGANLPPSSNIYVIRFRAPTAPHTLGGGTIDTTTQVRYWSLCVYDITTRPISCTPDELAPVDAGGEVTFAIGPSWAKPPILDADHSVIWVDLGSSLLQFGTYVVLRELEPSASFAFSARAVPVGAAPDGYMGPYAPVISQCSTVQFQQGGCR